jgi:ATP-dependent Clp protease protease subunit
MKLHLEEPHPPAVAAPTPSGPFTDELSKRLLATRRILLTGEIHDRLAAEICAQMLVLDSDGDAPIALYINSPGGAVDAGFAIYDTMQALQCDVETVALGIAASMGQFLLTAGTPGKRYAAPHAQILMHQPHGAVRGVARDIEIQARQFEYLRKKMAELTAAHSGQPVERVIADADRDRWFTAPEAVEYGLVDHVVVPPHPSL